MKLSEFESQMSLLFDETYVRNRVSQFLTNWFLACGTRSIVPVKVFPRPWLYKG